MGLLLIAASLSLQLVWIISLQLVRDGAETVLRILLTLSVLLLSGFCLAMAGDYGALDLVEGLWLGVTLLAVIVEHGLSATYRVAVLVMVCVEAIASTHW